MKQIAEFLLSKNKKYDKSITDNSSIEELLNFAEKHGVKHYFSYIPASNSDKLLCVSDKENKKFFMLARAISLYSGDYIIVEKYNNAWILKYDDNNGHFNKRSINFDTALTIMNEMINDEITVKEIYDKYCK